MENEKKSDLESDNFARFENYPEIIESPISMVEENSPIQIFKGEFLLKNDTQEFKINGQISFIWFPERGPKFSGTIITTLCDFDDIDELFLQHISCKIIINEMVFGEGFISLQSFDDSKGNYVEGVLSQFAIRGDKSVNVDKIRFVIPNVREFFGEETTIRNTETNTPLQRSRIILENEKYIINIDKCHDYENRFKSLKNKGGYNILYNGELTKKRGVISFSEIEEIFSTLNTFITFLNGRKTSALFIEGISDDKISWCDFSSYPVDSYKFVQTFSIINSIDGFNEMWKKFSTLWKNEENKYYLSLAIHWYAEANGNSGYTEGPIIMAQTALELLYNWWIVEIKKLIRGKDIENLGASNKIRLLISQLNISNSVPANFSELNTYITKKKLDAPDIIVQIRNALVHSQVDKLKNLKEIPPKAKFEALQLCIWYIELSLLCILEFNGQYENRCTEEAEDVPWKNNTLDFKKIER